MNPATLLRTIGAFALFGSLALTGWYNITGIPLLVMTVGFACAFELLAVRAAKTSPRKGAALAVVILVALGIIAAMSVPTSESMRPATAAAPTVSASYAMNYPDCLLKNLPGVQNDAAAIAANQLCMSKFPAGMDGVAQGIWHASGDFASGAECTLLMAANTQSQRAGQMIRAACMRLYEEDGPWLQYQ